MQKNTLSKESETSPAANSHLALPSGVMEYIRGTFPEAIQIMLGGSYAKGSHNSGSDVDLLVLMPKVQSIVREIVQLEDALLDVAIHDFDSVRRILSRERMMSVCALADDIECGIFLRPATPACLELKFFAENILRQGPNPSFEFDGLRNHLLGQASDLPHVKTFSERVSIVLGIGQKLMTFAIRSKGGWIGAGKYLGRDLDKLYPGFAPSLGKATGRAIQEGFDGDLIALLHDVLAGHYGTMDRNWRQEYAGL